MKKLAIKIVILKTKIKRKIIPKKKISQIKQK
jgi:hypothetical protein